MGQKNDIKKKIIDAFYEILKKNPFAKVRVTNITAVANISHQTFYRYYLDKHDLAGQIAYDRFAMFFDIYGHDTTWKDVVMVILNSIHSYPVFFKRMFEDPEGRDIIAKTLNSITKNFSGKDGSNYTAAVWIAILTDWANDNFEPSIDNIYDKFRMFIPVIEVLPKKECDQILNTFEKHDLDYFINQPEIYPPPKK